MLMTIYIEWEHNPFKIFTKPIVVEISPVVSSPHTWESDQAWLLRWDRPVGLCGALALL